MRTAAAGTRSTTLNRAAFGLGQLAGFGLGKPDELVEALLEATRHAGLPDSEACATIASGVQAGQLPPRQAPFTTVRRQ